MPKSIFFLLYLTLSFSSLGQDVKWSTSYDAESEMVTIKANIEEGWHLYSQDINEGIGPIATSFEFEPNKALFKLVGKTMEPTPITEYDPNFEGELSFFKDAVEFTQKIKVKSAGEIKGRVTFMICNEETCIPPADVDFNITINTNEK